MLLLITPPNAWLVVVQEMVDGVGYLLLLSPTNVQWSSYIELSPDQIRLKQGLIWFNTQNSQSRTVGHPGESAGVHIIEVPVVAIPSTGTWRIFPLSDVLHNIS